MTIHNVTQYISPKYNQQNNKALHLNSRNKGTNPTRRHIGITAAPGINPALHGATKSRYTIGGTTIDAARLRALFVPSNAIRRKMLNIIYELRETDSYRLMVVVENALPVLVCSNRGTPHRA
jgi:hypothetical protein